MSLVQIPSVMSHDAIKLTTVSGEGEQLPVIVRVSYAMLMLAS